MATSIRARRRFGSGVMKRLLEKKLNDLKKKLSE